MKINHFLQLIILFLCALWNFPSYATPIEADEAKKWAENKGKEIIEILSSTDIEKKYAQLDEIVNNDLDLDYAAKFVVGKYWRQMTDTQKSRYLEIFKKYVQSSYQNYNLDLEKGSVDFTITDAIKNNETTDVFCTIVIHNLENVVDQSSSGGVQTIFSLIKNNNRIQVRDLKIEESSFLLAYRQRFYKMIHEDADDEIDWFLTDLENIVEDNYNNIEQNF